MTTDQFVVLADDLTSAAEAAGHLVDAGRPAAVLLDHEAATGFDDVSRGSDAQSVESQSFESQCVESLCVDLDSRALTPEAAAARHESVARRLRAPGLYKTMDSSLRGNWAAELAATLRGSRRRVAVVAPAYPTYHRATVDGRQLVDGVPVHAGPAGRDPIRPVRDASIANPLAAAGLTVKMIRAGDDLAMADGLVLVADATTEADLAHIANAVRPHLADLVLCGSPGLLEALLPARPRPCPVDVAVAMPVLVVAGSLHPTTRAQLTALAAAGVPVHTTAEPAHRLAALLASHPVVALTTPELPDPETDHLRLLAAIAADCARGLPEFGLVLTGGDTAREVALALGSSRILSRGTVAAGIPVGVLRGPNSCLVITKAGGFGAPDSLITVTQALARRTP